MTLYTVIDNFEKPFRQLYGPEGEEIQQNIILSSQVSSGQRLPEGKWEYRRYANGAVALVCSDRQSKLLVDNGSGESLLLSPEAISLAANLLVLNEKAEEQAYLGSQSPISVMHLALREAIIRDIPSILITSMSPEVEMRPPYSQREIKIAPHAEAEAIVLISG